ncbi:hypothetical protein SAMN05216389_103264 [Oceanobacillus limi]|uniref:Uncharacterized protein n=1 Tax=Oceanobacillus limi TaxID=930131 RepID=A0A1I0AK36_9BACI|nr:hypothetical protein [Oceanobacillus limi]SES94033.1 hypothetical protein SAMN05216389_103264 [Oceanobacillus limi]
MYRFVSFLIIFSIVGILLYFHEQTSHCTTGDVGHHQENIVEIKDTELIPSVKGKVKQDKSGSWFVHIETENFTFAPEKVGNEVINIHEGHAHLYLNGEKINRLYGEYYNLDYLDKGSYTVKVTLNANNHGVLMHEGNTIGFEQDFTVE